MEPEKGMQKTSDCEDKYISEIKMTKLHMIKNVFVLSTGVLLMFIAYDGLAMLQSTMNREHGIGVACQAIIYAGFCVSSVLFPKYVLTKLGSKRTFVLSMWTYIPYIASNFYPHWVLMIPSSILVGLGASLLWCSQATYLNDIAVMYATLTFDSEKKPEISFISSEVKDEKAADYESQKKSQQRFGLGYYYQNPKPKKMEQQNGTVRSDSSFCYCAGKITLETTGSAYFGESKYDHDSLSDIKVQLDSSSISNGVDCKTNYGGCEDSAHHTHTNIDQSLNVSKIHARDEIQPKSKVIESTTARFFGFHGMAYLSSHMWSNLMTYYVLRTDVGDTFSNSSCICGADFCNVESECFVDNLQAPSDSIRNILTGACTCIGVISILIVALFLDPLEKENRKVSFTLKLMMATYRIAKEKELLLLIPASLYIGMFQGFYTGDFTKSFIGCAWGTYHVGLVAACYGFACGAASTVAGWLVKQLGRISIFVSAAVVNVACNVLLLLWIPDREHTQMFFFAAALWGVYVGVIWSQLRALYGMLFKADEEAAFAAFYVWYSLGFCLSLGYSNYFCTYVKIYILLFVSTLAFIGYLLLERTQKIKLNN